tara:strand:+ start:38410 stop:38961 length:552 start_codon:yes stop_codon:yes gene_type:complete
MSGARSRRTGASFERQVANLLTGATGVRWARTKPGDFQEWGDITPRGLLDGPWADVFVECKAHQSVFPRHLLKPTKQIVEWWDTTCEQADNVSRNPVMFVRFKGFGVVMIAHSETMESFGYHAPSGNWEVSLPFDYGTPGPVVAVEAEVVVTFQAVNKTRQGEHDANDEERALRIVDPFELPF